MWLENYHFGFYNELYNQHMFQNHLSKIGNRKIFDVERICNFAMQKKKMAT